MYLEKKFENEDEENFDPQAQGGLPGALGVELTFNLHAKKKRGSVVPLKKKINSVCYMLYQILGKK